MGNTRLPELRSNGGQDRVTDDARQLAEALSPLPPLQSSPALVIVSGLPGTGKTYFSNRLAARVPAVILQSDALRKRLFYPPDYSPGESARLFRAIHALAAALLAQKRTVIMDATSLTEKDRKPLYRIAEETGARLIAVQITAPPALVKKRLQTRPGRPDNRSDADWAVYRMMAPAL